MKVQYITGSRADFGLMESSLRRIMEHELIDLSLVVTGQHLLKQYGDTVKDIETAEFPIVARIPVNISGSSGVEMGLAFAKEMTGFLKTFVKFRPDLVLVLGDRGEMLAATLAAIHCGICVAHIHGGEVSGTLDESFRHAISKLSHFHFVATEDARVRLVKMGEKQEHIWTVGAPGLVGITQGTSRKSGWLQRKFGVPRAELGVLCVYHPVVQEAAFAGEQFAALLGALNHYDCSGVILRPNSDAGATNIESILEDLPGNTSDRFVVIDHIDRETYLNCLANVDLMIGNSSSGIIESASFGIANVNVGSRQNGRLRNENTVDCLELSSEAIRLSIGEALQNLRDLVKTNVYGDGKTDGRLADLLSQLPISNKTLAKKIAY